MVVSEMSLTRGGVLECVIGDQRFVGKLGKMRYIIALTARFGVIVNLQKYY